MAVSKVELANGEVLMDLTGDSVTPDTLAEGETAHDATGEPIVGRMKSGGGVSVQSDWNQTDETAADFIKNKPFGDFPAVILEEQELPYSADMGGCVGTVSAPIYDGDSLTIVYDGESYECTAATEPNMGVIVFGNLSVLGGDDTGEPFCAAIMSGIITIMDVDPDNTQNHTVKISGAVPKKINPKYLETFSKIYLSQGSSSDTKYLCSDVLGQTPISKADLVEAAKRPIVLSLGDSLFLSPIMINPYAGDNWGYISVFTFAADIEFYYTAEYTPTT